MYSKSIPDDVITSLVAKLKAAEDHVLTDVGCSINDFELEYGNVLKDIFPGIMVYGDGYRLGVILLRDFNKYKKHKLYVTQEGVIRRNRIMKDLEHLANRQLDNSLKNLPI